VILTIEQSYISYRQSYAHHPAKKTKYSGPSGNGFSDFGRGSAVASEDQQGLLSGADYDDGDAVIEMDLLPPRWADISDEVTDLLAEIAKKSQTLERLHQKHVLPGFNDEEAKKAEEDEIERLTQTITRSFHDCHRCIQRVEQMVKDGNMTRAEETMAKNIQVSLATRVQEASAGFRKKQSAYLKSRLSCPRPTGHGWWNTNLFCRTTRHVWTRNRFPRRKVLDSIGIQLCRRPVIARVRCR
jgi:syntaxin 16